MIDAAHVLLFTQDADADRAFLRDVLGWPSVAVAGDGDSWLIFRLPPAEMAIHPTEGPPTTELYLMCADLTATLAELAEKGVSSTREPQQRDWGIVTSIRLPSGTELGLYQPRHATAFQI